MLTKVILLTAICRLPEHDVYSAKQADFWKSLPFQAQKTEQQYQYAEGKEGCSSSKGKGQDEDAEDVA